MIPHEHQAGEPAAPAVGTSRLGWEIYLTGLEHSVRLAANHAVAPVVVTEHGMTTDDDARILTTDDRRSYPAGDPDRLRWVHLAFTDAFLVAQAAVGRNMSRFGPAGPTPTSGMWSRSARALGATELPISESQLAEARRDTSPRWSRYRRTC